MRSNSSLLKVFLTCILIGLATQAAVKLNRQHIRTVQRKQHPSHKLFTATAKPSASLVSIATAIGKFAKTLPKPQPVQVSVHAPKEKSHSHSHSESSSSSKSHPHHHDHHHHHHHNGTCNHSNHSNDSNDSNETNDTNDTNETNETNDSGIFSLIATFISKKPQLHIDPPRPRPKTPSPVVVQVGGRVTATGKKSGAQ